MRRSIRRFNNPPFQATQGHLTDVRAREGGEFDQKGLSVNEKLEPYPDGVGHLNPK